jgi:hypothetical protein
MRPFSQFTPVRAALLRRSSWICLFLAFFLLYNPFLASSHAANGLEVCHPASHRATVGASELQHFTPATGWDCLETANITDVEVPQPLPDLTADVLVTLPLVSPLPPQFFGPGLWFRPPPAR